MSTRKYSSVPVGPIGTKLGTFIINEALETENKHVPISSYDKYLIDSITLGIKWLYKTISENAVDEKFHRYYEKFNRAIQDGKYSDELNQDVIETSYDLNSRINRIIVQRQDKKKIGHLGPEDLNKITEKDVDFTRGLMVQTVAGKFELFLYVHHSDHYDVLPYEYIAERVKELPKLYIGDHQIN